MSGWLRPAYPCIEGVDTRRLTRHLRERGAMRGSDRAGKRARLQELTARAAGLAVDGRTGPRLAGDRRASATREGAGPHVVAYDFGMKRNIVRMLVQAGCRVTVVPSTTRRRRCAS